jgi:5-methylcytosine-specific restriction protein A
MCKHPGCNLYTVTRSAYCATHDTARNERQREADHDRRKAYPRESRQARGYDEQWRRVRAVYLRRQPFCEQCIEGDRVTPAVLVHHIERIEDRPELRLHMINLRALCNDCHEQAHGRKR